MDVNGTRFHLIKGLVDWRRCREEEHFLPSSAPAEPLVTSPDLVDWENVAYDRAAEMLTLNPKLALFPRGSGGQQLDLAARRGVARDQFGNWYWIGNDRQTIFWQPRGSRRPVKFWAADIGQCTVFTSDFQSCDPPPPEKIKLAGLAVTEHHYLVAGDVTRHGVLIFDLHASGAPLLVSFPAEALFVPFDLASMPGGGVWILDREHCVYWGLDRQFRVLSEPGLQHEIEPAEPPLTFHPSDGSGMIAHSSRSFPNGFSLAATKPIAIEALPDGSVLILNRTPAGSEIYRYRFSQLLGAVPLPKLDDVTAESSPPPVIGYDFAVTSALDDEGRQQYTLYAVEDDGNQAIAFSLSLDPLRLETQRGYLPLHFFGGRALVASEGAVFYDVVGGDAANDRAVRMIKLQEIEQPRYSEDATLYTPVFDGRERDCVWHRLFLDGCISPETSVAVWTRAHNDSAMLEGVPFTREPELYLRGAGAELPFYQPFPLRDPQQPVSPSKGVWELLFQRATGRYLQLKLELHGNGRVTPQLRALRIYYPRFSYPKRFLPTVYLEDTESASFLERMLANMEGFYTDTEGRLQDVGVLFDARSALPETLEWLAGWVGLIVDPLWESIQARRMASAVTRSGIAGQPAYDRRRLLIRFARKLYERRGTVEGIHFALHLFLDPCLEVTLQRFKAAAVRYNPALQDRLKRLELPYPTPQMSEAEFEDLLYQFVLSPRLHSPIRIVERFLTRGGRSVAAGDPTQLTEDATAHRFTVLVPEALTPEETDMVERIVRLEKPAHTHFTVRRYFDFFRVGEVRLGIDTVLGESGRFVAMVLGQNYLAEGYLAPSHPADVTERVVADRDRIGQMPPL